ncbi:MAG TPA: PAC2 family protein [Acidimicrobiales bacterium]|nr:PAC2 family protein [Acidimicrobiales bacterium]
MEHVRWAGDVPTLDEPVLIFAFEGWSDAGDSASTALQWLRDRCAGEPLAEIDGEEFYDFTATRPHVLLEDGVTRSIEWPTVDLTWGDGCGRDVVTMLGHEPQLRWRTFARQVLDVADSLGVGFVLSFGALLTDVPHTVDTSIIGTSTDQAIIDRFGLQRSGYEGPTGIVGVLHDTLSRAGLPSASLWAPVPAYVPGAPSPKGALALIRRAGQILDVGFTTTDLEIESAAYERQVSSVVAQDEEMTEYVEQLEQRYAEERQVPSPDELVAEVERFLREQS